MTTPISEGSAPYRHVVLFSFKDSATREDIANVERAFVALKDQIAEIVSLEWGTNVSPEGKDQGYTHCFFATFKNKADLETYLPHPDHQHFGTILRPSLDKVLVLDYIAQTSVN